MGEPNNQEWKMGLGTPSPAWSIPALPREQAGVIPGDSHSSRSGRGRSRGCTVTTRGFRGHLALFQGCCLVPILPCSAPLRAPSCRGGGRAAGHLLRGQGTPPCCPRGTCSLCLFAAPGCVPLALGAAPVLPWLQLLLVLVPVVTLGHPSQGLGHGLPDTLGQFRDILRAQAPRFHPGEDLDGAGPWERREKPGMC